MQNRPVTWFLHINNQVHGTWCFISDTWFQVWPLVVGGASYAGLQCLVLMRERILGPVQLPHPLISVTLRIFTTHIAQIWTTIQDVLSLFGGVTNSIGTTCNLKYLVKFFCIAQLFCARHRQRQYLLRLCYIFEHLTTGALCLGSGIVTRTSQDTCWGRLKDKRG